MQTYGQWHSAVFGGSLFQTAFRADASVNAFGAQAFFDLESENDPAEGLRITFNRSEFIGPAGDGVVVTVRDDDLQYRGLTTPTRGRSTSRSRIHEPKSLGAQDDHRCAHRYPFRHRLPSEHGHDRRRGGSAGWGVRRRHQGLDVRTVVVTAESDVRVAIASGGTAPADAATEGVTLVVAEYPRAFRLPAGHTLWVRSQTGSHDGSIEVYGLL